MDNNDRLSSEKAISVTLEDNSGVVHSVVDLKLAGREALDDLSSLIDQMKKAKEEINDFLTTLVNADAANNSNKENQNQATGDKIDDDDDNDDVDDGDEDN